MQYYEIVSVQSQLVSFIQKQQNAGSLFENMYCYWTYTQEKREYYNAGYTFWKSQKLIPSKKSQSVSIAKISSPETQKSPVRKNKLLQKFRATQ